MRGGEVEGRDGKEGKEEGKGKEGERKGEGKRRDGPYGKFLDPPRPWMAPFTVLVLRGL